MSWYERWPRYVPVAERRVKATRETVRLKKKGQTLSPVEVKGRGIASSFWGQAWCRNLESYSDYSNRLPRGRNYARNGSVIDLQVEQGAVKALVMGSKLYRITITIAPLKGTLWEKICRKCGGKINSLVELLQGRISNSVMETVSRRGEGLFPTPQEIKLNCSCPDWADMCKHVAAALYGVGARLDQKPELLFLLRKVDHEELILDAGSKKNFKKDQKGKSHLATTDLANVFGIDLDTSAPSQLPSQRKLNTNSSPPHQNPSSKRKRLSSRSKTKKTRLKKSAPPDKTALYPHSL